MSAEMAKLAVRTLQGNFKREFPADGIKAVWKELIAQPGKAIEAAVDALCLSNSYLPSPQVFLDRVKQEAKKIAAEQSRQREREWAEQKGGETPEQIRRQGSIFTREMQDAHAKHSVQAILLMLSPASREDKLECFRMMDKNYPGVGWAHEGMKLQKEWQGPSRKVQPASEA